MTAWRPIAAVVASLLTLAVALAWAHALDVSLFATAAWLELAGSTRASVSLVTGLGGGSLVVLATRRFVDRSARGDAWLEALGPSLEHATIVTTVLAAVAEEALFRGVLAPRYGLVASALAFAAMHAFAPRGARLAWVTASFVMGLALGTLFLATGDLVGAIAAHALVNAANLRWLRTQYERRHGRARYGEVARRTGARPLAGLLARSPQPWNAEQRSDPRRS